MYSFCKSVGQVNGHQKEPGSTPEPEKVDTLCPLGPEGQGQERAAAPTEDIYSARAVSAVKARTGHKGRVGEVPGTFHFHSCTLLYPVFPTDWLSRVAQEGGRSWMPSWKPSPRAQSDKEMRQSLKQQTKPSQLNGKHTMLKLLISYQ